MEVSNGGYRPGFMECYTATLNHIIYMYIMFWGDKTKLVENVGVNLEFYDCKGNKMALSCV
jgi:hypothetical protein